MEAIEKQDNNLKLSTDQIGGDKIMSGNVAGSVAAIGAGANVIYNKVERALTHVESLEQDEEFGNKRLGEALTTYVHRLELQAALAKEDPGYGNPYKALLEFDIRDAALFYGRTIAIRELLAHIKRDQLTVLHAGSGLGKTSLLKAGIMPRLLADGHLPLYVRPYQTPVHLAVKRALLVDVEETPQLARISLHDFLHRATSLMSGGYLVVIIDQFEELFTVQNEQARNEFVDQLCNCLDDDLLPVRWIISLRDEWFGQLGTFRPHIRNPYANEFLLRPLTRPEASLVITQPAARRQISYEPALVERLMDDVGKDEIAPPHLQLVCSILFDMVNGKTEITQAMYEEAGEAKGILRGYLYRVLSHDMPQKMREPAHLLLEALVTSEKRRALRTREDLTAEMSTWGYTPAMVDEVLDQLTDSRLLRVEEFMLDKMHSVAAYELAHDYLLDEIEIAPDVQARKAAQELLNQKLPYYKREKLLLSSQELSIILPQRKWLYISDEGAALIRESQALATRQKRILLAGIATAVVLLIFAIAAIGFIQNQAANREAQAANMARAAQANAENAWATSEANRAIAEAAQANAEIARANAETEATNSLSSELAAKTDLAKSLGEVISAYQLAAQSYEKARIFESQSALYTALSLPLPERIFRFPPDVDVVFTSNFSPEGDRMVTASSDHLARIWDVNSGEELLALAGHEDQVLFAEFSNDGDRVVTSSVDDTVKIWDAKNGNVILTIPAHEGDVHSVVFSPDDSLIVSAGRDDTAAIWDAATGELLYRLQHEDSVMHAEFSPDGKSVLTADEDGIARIWDVRTGRQIFTLEGHTDDLYQAAFNFDGTRIVTASKDRTARVWDAETGETLVYLVPHNGEVMSANFDPEGRYIVTTSVDHMARLWDAKTGALITLFPGQRDQVRWANFSPDGRWIATASNDATVWLRETLGISGTPSFISHTRDVNSVNFNRDGNQIVTGSTDRLAWIWNTQTGKRLVQIKGHGAPIRFAVFSPDGTRIATTSDDKTVRVWSAADGSELYRIDGKAWTVNFSPRDGRQLVTAGADGFARVWDARTGKELLPALEGHQKDVRFAAFSPDGKLIVTTGKFDGTVRIWDAKTHKPLEAFPIVFNNEVNSATFSPDGKRLVIAADDGVAQVWDLDRKAFAFPLNGHQADVDSANYSPDGSMIVTSSDDHTVRLWNALTGDPLAIMQGHDDEVYWAIFSPDGKWIYSSSGDRTVRTWPVDFDELHEFIRSELLRLKIE